MPESIYDNTGCRTAPGQASAAAYLIRRAAAVLCAAIFILAVCAVFPALSAGAEPSVCTAWGCIRVYAAEEKDYTIDDVGLIKRDDGSVWASWEKAYSDTSYKVQLQARKNSQWVDAGKPVVTAASELDVSAEIAKRGAAYYRVSVFPTKGGPGKYRVYSASGKDDMGLAIDTAAVKEVRAYVDKKNKETIEPGWKKLSSGQWIFYDNSKNQCKGSWVHDGSHYYYLNDKGYMVTGWQAINGRWYYLEPTGSTEHPLGSRWSDTVTPDGYTVNKDGARLKDGQIESTTENTVSTDNYEKVKMSVPTNFRLSRTGSLQWDPVENADRYTVSYSVDGVSMGSMDVSTPTFKIYTDTTGKTSKDRVYADGVIAGGTTVFTDGDVTLKIYACSPKVGNKYTRTKAVEIADLAAFIEEHTAPGTFISKAGKYMYEDENGQTVTGWQFLGGSWYHFDEKGYAAGPGWLENGGYTYYFDRDHRMVTGEQTIDGVKYQFNDGSDDKIPYGALMK